MDKKKNIVITGAQGQDGIILSKLLIKKKFNVIGIVKRIGSNKISKVKYYKVNLLNFKSLSKFLNKYRPHSLIHLGTENPNYLELKKNKDFYKRNLNATKNLIDYFSHNKSKKKLILIGSSQMYGMSKNKVSLRSNFNPANSYAKFRVEAYNYMLKIKKKYKSNMVTAILFNHDSMFRKKKFLIPRLVKLIKSKNTLKIESIFKENISGDFSHADDICNGLYKLMISKKNPNKLIFSSNKRIFINDIINFLLNLNRIDKKFILKKPKSSFTPIGDNKYTKKILNWKIKKNIFFAAKELNKFYS
tara:strand:+ start:1360 stop:2268 length:909 start_codon:yes stop_codon:yes gene_type:complete